MKALGIVLIGIGVGIAASIVLFFVLGGGVGNSGGPTDEEFLEIARAQAQGSAAGGNDTALLPPATGDFDVPILQVETDAYDIGLIKNNVIAEGVVTVYNRGTAPLRISKITTSCGCTLGKMKDNIIPPGGESTMLITVNPFRIPKFTSEKTLTIYSNDPRNSAQKVTVAARIEPEYQVDPEQIDFGVIPKGKGAEFSVTVRQAFTDSFEIKDVVVSQNREIFDFYIEEKPKAQWLKPDHREYTITGRVLPNAKIGSHISNVRLTTNLERSKLKEIAIPMRVKIEGVYKLDPPYVTLRKAEAGQTFENVTKLISQVPVEILGVEAPNEMLHLSYRPGDEPNTILFSVTVDETASERVLQDNWTISLKADGIEYKESIRIVAIMNTGETAPAIAPKIPSDIVSQIKKSLEGIDISNIKISPEIKLPESFKVPSAVSGSKSPESN